MLGFYLSLRSTRLKAKLLVLANSADCAVALAQNNLIFNKCSSSHWLWKRLVSIKQINFNDLKAVMQKLRLRLYMQLIDWTLKAIKQLKHFRNPNFQNCSWYFGAIPCKLHENSVVKLCDQFNYQRAKNTRMGRKYYTPRRYYKSPLPPFSSKEWNEVNHCFQGASFCCSTHDKKALSNKQKMLT